MLGHHLDKNPEGSRYSKYFKFFLFYVNTYFPNHSSNALAEMICIFFVIVFNGFPGVKLKEKKALCDWISLYFLPFLNNIFYFSIRVRYNIVSGVQPNDWTFM